MGRLLPTSSDVKNRSPQDKDPRLIGVDSDEAEDVFSALSSDTSREILSNLYEEPRTPSDLADSIDTSLQNARYHLSKLEDAGLVEVVDTWYSSKGKEMKVYGPASGAVLVFAGENEGSSKIKDALTSMMSAFVVLGLASAVIQLALTKTSLGDLVPFGGFGVGSAGGDSGFSKAEAGGAQQDQADGGEGDGSGDGGDTGDAGGDAADAPTEDQLKSQEGDAEPDGGRDAVGDEAAGGDGGDADADTSGDGGDAGGGDGAKETTEGDLQQQNEAMTGNETELYNGDFDARTTTENGTGDLNVSVDNQTVESGNMSSGDGINETVSGSMDAASDLAASIPPGLLFFAGGAIVLLIGSIWWYRRNQNTIKVRD